MKVSSNKVSGEYTLKLCNEKVSWATATTFGINKLDFSLAFVSKLSWATTQSLIHINQHFHETTHCDNGLKNWT